MKSLIYGVGIRLIFGLLLIFSLVMLLRGHNLPGGGFIGGLIGALAFIVFSIGVGPGKTRAALRLPPFVIAALGLSCALFAGFLGWFAGAELFTSQWLFIGATETDKGFPLSSVLLFDLGVYLTVLGSVMGMVLLLEEFY
jgi:Multisubunit Na+/H+ antiporter, MnhB subunit